MSDDSKQLSLWSDYSKRKWLYDDIVIARPGNKNLAILSADRLFFEALSAEILAEREAIAISLDQAGKHVEADLVRGRPAPPEWRKP